MHNYRKCILGQLYGDYCCHLYQAYSRLHNTNYWAFFNSELTDWTEEISNRIEKNFSLEFIVKAKTLEEALNKVKNISLNDLKKKGSKWVICI